MAPIPRPDHLLNRAQVAAILGLSVSGVSWHRRKPDTPLPVYVWNGRSYNKREDVLAYHARRQSVRAAA